MCILWSSGFRKSLSYSVQTENPIILLMKQPQLLLQTINWEAQDSRSAFGSFQQGMNEGPRVETRKAWILCGGWTSDARSVSAERIRKHAETLLEWSQMLERSQCIPHLFQDCRLWPRECGLAASQWAFLCRTWIWTPQLGLGLEPETFFLQKKKSEWFTGAEAEESLTTFLQQDNKQTTKTRKTWKHYLKKLFIFIHRDKKY